MKDLVLKHLKEHRGQYVSGEAISTSLGVSRTAVWKYIHELKTAGYGITSSSRKGYLLEEIPDVLNASEIREGLNTAVIGKRVHCFETIDSTNIYGKKIASEGCEDGTLVVSEYQTAGRGRLGRQWDSSDKKGIWMSVVLKPFLLPEEVPIITLAVSVAIVDAIKAATGIRTGIKWPNDIILEDKKVCGILTEMSCEMEQVNFIVIGIGLNVNQELEDFSEEVRNKATSLKMAYRGKEQDIQLRRSSLIRQILMELEKQYEMVKTGQTGKIVEQWRQKSVMLGKEVRVYVKGIERIGRATDITNDGKLILQEENGQMHEIMSGEVSVRGMLEYI